MPLLSVLITTSINGVRTLDRTLKDLAKENLTDVEIISAPVPTSGPVNYLSMRQTLLGSATGTYVAFLHSSYRIADDYITNIKFALSSNPDAVSIYTSSMIFSEGKYQPITYHYSKDHTTIRSVRDITNCPLSIGCPIKRTILLPLIATNLLIGSASFWVNNVYPYINTQAEIKELLYYEQMPVLSLPPTTTTSTTTPP